ncbi:MAG: hypothetical protein HUJ51_03480 [Eggerthellaceae bacterium]|nr:hypothetical protein [Eggerthellaceae bacterium]
MFDSNTEACMVAVHVAMLNTENKDMFKMGGDYHPLQGPIAYGLRIMCTKSMQFKGAQNYTSKHNKEFFMNDLGNLERKLHNGQHDDANSDVYTDPIWQKSGTRHLGKEFVMRCE